MTTLTPPGKTVAVRHGNRVETVGYYQIPGSGEYRGVTVTRAASGAFWTTWDGIAGGRDFRHRAAAVKFLKRTLAELSVTWFE